MIWKPWTLFTVAVAGWMSQQQQEVIAYLREENKILHHHTDEFDTSGCAARRFSDKI